MKIRLLLLSIAVALGLLLMPVATALAQPAVPIQYEGTVTIGGSLAPVGTTISAEVADDEIATNAPDGIDEKGYYRLDVSASEGDLVILKVNGVIGGQATYPDIRSNWHVVCDLAIEGEVVTHYTLTVDVSPSGAGTVSLSPTAVGNEYEEDTMVELTASAASGYEFDSWGGDLTGSTNPDTITMDSDMSVTATFSEIPVTDYTLTMAVNGSGSTSPAVGKHPYAADTVVSIIATPASGYQFVNWTGAVASPNSASTTVTMDSNKTVTAKFTTKTPPSGDGAAPPTYYYTETNLFGTEESFRISSSGKILSTIEATSADGNLTITIPKDTVALDEDGKWLKTLEAAVDETPPDPPEDAHIIGLAYDFGPDGATFDPAITLEYTYDPDALPEGVDEEDLVLAYYDEATGEWVEVDSVVDTVNNTITASVAHFTTFAIIAVVPVVTPPAPAAFSVTNLSVTPLEVEPGETVTIAVLVANTGGEAGSYQVTLVINDLVEATKEVTVRAGLSKEVTFSVTKEEAGSYTVTVDGLSGSFTVVTVVVAPEPAAFSVSYLSVSPRLEVEPGETVTITMLVANTGGESGSYTVVLKIDGVKEAEETVTIAAGESQEVSFSVTREDPGDYTVDVDGLSDSFTVVLLVEPPGINWALIGGIIGGLIVVAGLLYYFLVFRRRAY